MFTPELLISTPRRGAAVPNPDGTLAIFSQSEHVIGGKTSKEYRVLNVKTGEIGQLIVDEKASNVVWLGHDNNIVLFFSKGDEGYTWIKTVDAGKPDAGPTTIGFIETPVSDLKVKALEDGSVAFVVTGLVDTDGILYNERNDGKLHSARIFDNMNPRVVSNFSTQARELRPYSAQLVGFVRSATGIHALVYNHDQKG
jgi:hypothetical protein